MQQRRSGLALQLFKRATDRRSGGAELAGGALDGTAIDNLQEDLELFGIHTLWGLLAAVTSAPRLTTGAEHIPRPCIVMSKIWPTHGRPSCAKRMVGLDGP
jgi:hypothetical protein